MLKRLLLVFLIIISCKSILPAQDEANEVRIQGTIREAGTDAPVPYVHIVNATSGYGTISNTEGRFWIKMQRNDTLLFSAIGFETYAFTLRPDQPSRRLRVTIEMNSSTQVLKPVSIFAYRDEESLKRALIEMETTTPQQTEEVVIPGIKRPTNINPSITLSGPISFLYNKFSRKAKAQKKLKDDIAQYDYRKALKAKYNEQVVLELTGLPEDEIEAFMNFCKIEDVFIEGASEYEIAVAVSSCLEKYQAEEH